MLATKKRLEFGEITNRVYQHGFGIKTKGKINNLPFITNKDQLVYDLSTVNEMASLIKRFGRLSFYHDYDQFEILKKIDKTQTLFREEFKSIFDFSELSEEIRLTLITNTENNYEKLKEITKTLTNLDVVIKLGSNYFDHNYELFDHVSPTLGELRKKYKNLNHKVNDVINSALKKNEKYLTDKMIVMRAGRNCLPVNISYKNNVSGIIHDYSASYQTAYIEPIELVNIANEIENTKALISAEELKIYYEITIKLKQYNDVFYNNFEVIHQIDFIHARAIYSNEINGVLPHFSNNEHIIREARHPLLNKDEVVPIDLIFESENKIILLTGANTGGKTVSLKTLGLITLMLQSGLLIPVHESSRVKLFTNVFVDVGDGQSIVESLSTFSAHLANLSEMITELDDNSLVLIDELGSGTDPKEGSSIAKAIIDYMCDYNLKALITTHYSELKEYGLERSPEIKLARLKFNLNTLSPEYEIEYDLVGSSHALLIAERLGFNQSIIKNAYNYFEKSKTDSEKIQEVLTLKEEGLLEREKLLLEKQKQYEVMLHKLNLEENQWEADKQKYLLKLTDELKSRYEPVIEQANNLIDQLKDQLTQREVAELKGSLNLSEEKPKIDLTPLKKGDYVYVTKYDQYGHIDQVRGNKYYVMIGNFSLSFNREDLILEKRNNNYTNKKVTTKKKKEKLNSYVETKNLSKDASYELDLRGVRYIEVYDLIDQAIDSAYLANLSSIKVIHGYGTGAVRKAVSEYIKSSSYIKSHRSGNEKEGMLGVTIIYLN